VTRQCGDFWDVQQLDCCFYIKNLSGISGEIKSGTGGVPAVQRKTTILMISGLPYKCDPFRRPFSDGILSGPDAGKRFLSVPAVAGCTKVSGSLPG